jgi:hypothetical protein
MSRDQYDISMSLTHTRCHGPDANLGDELDVHPRMLIRILEVMDELSEILDRIDVVMRRR